jgi:hypothetical protein
MFASVSFGFCICLQCFSGVFASVSYVFFCMLQQLHLDVSKVDQVLHMRCTWEAADGMGDIRGGAGPLQVRSLDARSLPVRAAF